MPQILKFGHRGDSGNFPENTMLAFNKALKKGCDGVELDGSLTKDGRVVIIHDEMLDRTTNSKGLVIETSFDEIRKLDAGQGQTVPTMEEVLDWAKAKGCLINFELKDRDMIDIVGQAISERNLERQVFVTSFLHDEIVEFKKRYSSIQVGFIFDHCPLKPNQMVRDAKENGVYILSMKSEWIFKWRGENIVNLAHGAGLKVHIWGVNDAPSIARMKAMDVDALIGNYPGLL
ncbi:MAG: glycerophosphodiester phosphodiesterase family protein [Minisyncoccia bacterium]